VRGSEICCKISI